MGASNRYRGTPDIMSPNLTVLFVGLNPGLRSGEIGHHFAASSNRFWDLLADSGLAPRRLDPAEDRLALGYGFGLTNLVARTTSGASDLLAAEVRQGAAALGDKIHAHGPHLVCYLGKGVFAGAAGRPGAQVEYGLQQGQLVPGSMDFVAHSPSGRATVPYAEKLATFRALAGVVAGMERDLSRAWQAGFAHNVVEHALALRAGETLILVADEGRLEVAAALSLLAERVGASFEMRPLEPASLERLSRDSCVVLAPSPSAWRSSLDVRRLTALPDGPKGRFRCVFLPPFPRESLFRTFSFPYREHVAFHDRLMVTLRDTKEMRVTSPSGTDVSFRVRPFAAHSFSVRHEGGFMLGLPVEVTTAPLEDSVEGRIVFDVSVHLGLTSEDVTLDVAGGLVRAMRRAGRPAGSRALPDLTLDLFLREVEERAREWPDALRVGEFGLGTSASARFSGCSMEDEAVSGSCHFALGANSDFGGNLRGPYHGGGEIARPTVSVDGRTILRDGLYLHRSLA